MAKLLQLDPACANWVTYIFQCPGCKCSHYIRTKGGPCVWQWNGDVDRPTVSPSILVEADDPARRCHSFIRDGKIEFLGDCGHELKGQTVELPEWTD